MSEEQKFDTLKTEMLLCQQQMDKYDQLSSTIRTWAITIWAASIGWFLQISKKEVLFLSLFIAVVFWILDSMNKNFREDYKERRNEVAKILSDYFKNGILAGNIKSPDLPSHERMNFTRKLFRPHIFPIYLSLLIISLVLAAIN